MRKIVSKGRYTLFFDDKKGDVDCVAYETGKHMSVEEVGDALNISRVCAGNNLKNSVLKIYKHMKNKKDMTPVDIICSMAITFNINSIKEYKQFLRLFPEDIRREVNEEAKRAA